MKTEILNTNHVIRLCEIDNMCMHMPWTQGMFENELTNENTYYTGVFDNDILVGYGGMWIVAGEGQITNIAVIPEYQKQGLGNKILRELILKAKNDKLKELTLEVRQSNLAAISLYEKNGFSACGLRKNYYKSPTENAVLMAKTIR